MKESVLYIYKKKKNNLLNSLDKMTSNFKRVRKATKGFSIPHGFHSKADFTINVQII